MVITEKTLTFSVLNDTAIAITQNKQTVNSQVKCIVSMRQLCHQNTVTKPQWLLFLYGESCYINAV